METKSERYFRRVVSVIASFFITVSFFGWTGPLHEENPWNTLFYTACVAYAVYTNLSNQIERDRLSDLKKKDKKSENESRPT